MVDQRPVPRGGCLATSQTLLVQAIVSLEKANTTHQTITKSPSYPKSSTNDTSPQLKNIINALDRLSRLHTLLFGPRRKDGELASLENSETEHTLEQDELFDEKAALEQIHLEQDFIEVDLSVGESVFDIVEVADAESCSPPQPCDTLLPYQPSLNLNEELKQFRKLVELRFESIPTGIPRFIVEKVAELEILFHLTRDQTTDCIWNVDHQVSPIEVLKGLGVFRQKCICVVAEGSKAKVHSTDPFCPKNKKLEDIVKLEVKEKAKEEKKEEEKLDPSEKIHSRELMAEMLDMIGPQHVKDHFRKIKETVTASFKEASPWEGKHFGIVLMGPASTGKDKIAKRYGKYLISCGIAKDNRIEREASYIIENDKLEDYFKRLEDGGVLIIENAHLLITYKHKDKLAMNYLLEQTEKKKGKITLVLHGEEPELREFIDKNKKTPLFPHVLALNEFKGEDALTIIRSGMENWFGEKTEVEGGWDGLYMRIAARRIAKKKDDEVTEAVGGLVKLIHQRQRKRINEARKAKGETAKKDLKIEKESSKGEKAEGKEAETEIILPEAGSDKSSLLGEQDKAKASKVQESSEKGLSSSLDSDDVPKTQSRASTMAVSSTPAVASVSSILENEKLTSEISPEKLKSAEEVQILLKQGESETSKELEDAHDSQDEISTTGQSTPISEPEVTDLKIEEKKLEKTIESAESETTISLETPASTVKGAEVKIASEKPSSTTTPLATISVAENKATDEKIEDSITESKDTPSSESSSETKLETVDTVEVVESSEKSDEVAKAENKPTDVVVVSKDAATKDDSASDGSESDNDSVTSEETAATDITTPDEKDDNDDAEDFLFTKDDILGPAPSNKVLESEAWKKLQKLTGLKKVKESLLNFLELAKTNYHRELAEKPLLEFTFNRCFLGPPGTGKTVVAKLYGQILAEIGVLSKGELIVKNAADLIGKYIGDSETNTKEALKEAAGNVLVLDEAYMLYTSDGVTNTTDCFRQGIIDTLVGGIQGVPGEDRCVLLLGYEEQMKNFLTECNPGLIRRFPLEDAFLFEDFTVPELKEILLMKLEEYGLEASPDAIKTAMAVLEKSMSRLNFGNGGAVENLITKAKSACLSRIIALPEAERPEAWLFEPRDFDPEFDRVDSATTNLKKLFNDVVGCEEIIEKFESYQLLCQAMKDRDMDPRGYIPTNFIFKGPPGTGKTTTARKIAQVYYDMGFLSEATVVECSVTDLIGSYIGQTGPKTAKALERGLGKVLFIDEAYRLAEGGRNSYATEAVSELVDCLTKPKFFGKIIVILAGYENEMNALLAMNPGLASRFPEEIMFDLLPAAGCLQVLEKKLLETGIAMPLMGEDDGDGGKVKGSEFERGVLERLLRNLAQTPGWGNARDVETLAKNIARKVFVDGLISKGKNAKGKKVEEKKGEGKKKDVKAAPVARARGEEKKEEVEAVVVVEEEKKEEEKVEEKKEEEKKPALLCTLDVATTAMEEMLAERKARDGMGIYPGMYC